MNGQKATMPQESEKRRKAKTKLHMFCLSILFKYTYIKRKLRITYKNIQLFTKLLKRDYEEGDLM